MKTLTTLLALAWPLCSIAAAAAQANAGAPPTVPPALMRPSPALAEPISALRQPPWVASFAAATARAIPQGTPSGRREVQALTGGGYDGVFPVNPPASGNSFGRAIARSGDILAVGASLDRWDPSDTNSATARGNGAVYIYQKTDGQWRQVQRLVADDGVKDDRFGTAVALSGDTLFVATTHRPNPGKVYVFKRSNGNWSQTQILTDGISVNGYSFGFGMALQGDKALIANARFPGNDGKVYAFSESNGVWSQTQVLEVHAAPNDPNGWGDAFGRSMAIDGSTALIGAEMASSSDGSQAYQGAAYFFRFSESDGTWTQGQRLDACGSLPGASAGFFGGSVALGGGTAFATAAYWGATGESVKAACLFAESAEGWTPTQVLEPENNTQRDAFGAQVALSGDVLVISAPLTNSAMQDEGGTNNGTTTSGAIYAFSRSNGVWSLSDTIERKGGILDYDGSYVDGMGFGGVAIDGTAILAAGISTTIGFYGGNGVVDVFDFPAQSAIAPASLAISLAAGANASATLRLANDGGGTSLRFAVDDGRTLTQTSDESPAAGVGKVLPMCADGVCQEISGTSGTSWYRRFYFDEHPQVGATAAVDAVTIGIERSPAGMPLTINLYTAPHAMPVDTLDPAQLTPIGSATVTADGTPDTMLRIPVSGTIDDTAGKDLVVEYSVEDFEGLPVFFPGANASPQSHATFMSFAADPSGQSYFAGSWSHILIAPHLDPAASGIGCANPTANPWLQLSPATGSVDAGAAQDLVVTVDATNLSPGQYTTQVCLATKGPMPSLIQVPVDVTVTASGDAIFSDGFDGG
ncbi:FG-GAP repeat protein [Dokdonella sp.]|uniref:FG-GAP repeat protein n=1 Tax=Dokdonella sp. TaxID=2291710 RepID=UPI001B13A459|nr:FG-GAP repeat protein [Dokdonella sp.]MBO9663304.1 hypothetical protein [Dokdonella sp.]